MKKWGMILLVLLLSLSFCSRNGKNGQTDVKKPIMVKVAEARHGTLVKALDYKGTVQAWKTANIIPDVSGRIGVIYKKQGDRVSKGEILAALDLTQLELQQKQARAAVAVAESAFKDAQLNYERMKKLYDSKAVAQMQYEKAQLGLDAADTQFKSAKANLDLVDYTLKNSSMRAPFDGVVAAKNMEEGDMINPMMGMGASVLTVLDLSKIKVVIDVAGEDIEKISVGQLCQVRVSSRENDLFRGEVYSKNLAADPMSKTFKVEISVENPQMRIKAGVFADIAIEVLRRENVLVLPLSSLIGDRDIMVAENGLAKRRTLKVGSRNDTLFEVLQGVQPGEKVVVEGGYDLKDGTPITVAGEKK